MVTCSRCGDCFEAHSEEQAEPFRLCIRCYKVTVRGRASKREPTEDELEVYRRENGK